MDRQVVARTPTLIALDLESILVPEIWEAVAERSGIEDLRLTTRDISDYDILMRRRIALCRGHGLTLSNLRRIVGSLEPLPKALEFLIWAQSRAPVVVLSDTFHELASPLIAKLGHPLVLCNSLEIDDCGYIVKYHLRKPDGKQGDVLAFKRLGFRVIAVGDSYNDTRMLAEADVGILFRPSSNVVKRFNRFRAVRSFEDLKNELSVTWT